MKSILSSSYLAILCFTNNISIMGVLGVVATVLAILNQVYRSKKDIAQFHNGNIMQWLKSFFKLKNRSDGTAK